MAKRKHKAFTKAEDCVIIAGIANGHRLVDIAKHPLIRRAPGTVRNRAIRLGALGDSAALEKTLQGMIARYEGQIDQIRREIDGVRQLESRLEKELASVRQSYISTVNTLKERQSNQ